MQITLGRAQGGLGFHDICSLYSTIKGELAQVVERLLNMRDVAGCPHSPGSFNFLVLCGGSHLQLDAANIPVKGGWKLKTKLIFQSMITLKSENQFFMTYSIPLMNLM